MLKLLINIVNDLDFIGFKVEEKDLFHCCKEERVNRIIRMLPFLKVKLLAYTLEYFYVHHFDSMFEVPFVVLTFVEIGLPSFINPKLIDLLLIHDKILATKHCHIVLAT